jgi:hypothetical protein
MKNVKKILKKIPVKRILHFNCSRVKGHYAGVSCTCGAAVFHTGDYYNFNFQQLKGEK